LLLCELFEQDVLAGDLGIHTATRHRRSRLLRYLTPVAHAAQLGTAAVAGTVSDASAAVAARTAEGRVLARLDIPGCHRSAFSGLPRRQGGAIPGRDASLLLQGRVDLRLEVVLGAARAAASALTATGLASAALARFAGLPRWTRPAGGGLFDHSNIGIALRLARCLWLLAVVEGFDGFAEDRLFFGDYLGLDAGWADAGTAAAATGTGRPGCGLFFGNGFGFGGVQFGGRLADGCFSRSLGLGFGGHFRRRLFGSSGAAASTGAGASATAAGFGSERRVELRAFRQLFRGRSRCFGLGGGCFRRRGLGGGGPAGTAAARTGGLSRGFGRLGSWRRWSLFLSSLRLLSGSIQER
jgi:hypothetical protein